MWPPGKPYQIVVGELEDKEINVVVLYTTGHDASRKRNLALKLGTGNVFHTTRKFEVVVQHLLPHFSHILGNMLTGSTNKHHTLLQGYD